MREREEKRLKKRWTCRIFLSLCCSLLTSLSSSIELSFLQLPLLPPVKGKKIDPKKITEKEKIRKIFVGGVALDTPEEDVKAHFEQFGAVEEIVFPTNKETKQRKGFCFITFVDAEACDAACAKQNAKQQVGSKMVDVKKVVLAQFLGDVVV